MTAEESIIRKCDLIASRVCVESDIDTREILDDALSYVNGNADAPYEFNERDLKRIMVNYIRHSKSSYDQGLKSIHRVARNASEEISELAYQRYKCSVLNEIDAQYPFLHDEIRNQKSFVEMVSVIPSEQIAQRENVYNFSFG